MDGNTWVAVGALALTIVLAIIAGVLRFGTLNERVLQNQIALADLSLRVRSDQLALEKRQVKFEDDIRGLLNRLTETIHRIDVRVATMAARMGASDSPEHDSLG